MGKRWRRSWMRLLSVVRRRRGIVLCPLKEEEQWTWNCYWSDGEQNWKILSGSMIKRSTRSHKMKGCCSPHVERRETENWDVLLRNERSGRGRRGAGPWRIDLKYSNGTNRCCSLMSEAKGRRPRTYYWILVVEASSLPPFIHSSAALPWREWRKRTEQ